MTTHPYPDAPAASPAPAVPPGHAASPGQAAPSVPFAAQPVPLAAQPAIAAPFVYRGVDPKPAVWPVAVFSVLFGPLGAISAVRRACQARAAGARVAPYWIVQAAGFVVFLVLGLIGTSLFVPAYLNYREAVLTKALESAIVHDTVPTPAGVSVVSADCTPLTAVAASDGTRVYRCQIAVSDGHGGPVNVVTSRDGTWRVNRAG